MTAPRVLHTLPDMSSQHPVHRVEIGLVGTPPARQLERASGVSAVEIHGSTVHCLVTGSFQPLLEALRGHEVITLQSTPTADTQASSPRAEESH
jgi:hypothetical protein